MNRVLRSFVVLLAAVAFMVTSVGWSMAASRPAAPTVAAVSEMHAHGGHDHASAHKEAAACKYTTDTGACDNDHSHDGGPASSCCALACHMAIPSAFDVGPWAKLVPVIGDASLHTGLDDAGRVRLERPPRFSII